jgi:hypothetical protein
VRRSDYLLLLLVLVLLLLLTRKHDRLSPYDNSTDGVGRLVFGRVKESGSESLDCDSTVCKKGGGKLLSSSSSDSHERPRRRRYT